MIFVLGILTGLVMVICSERGWGSPFVYLMFFIWGIVLTVGLLIMDGII